MHPDAEHTPTDNVAIARLQEQVRSLYRLVDGLGRDMARRDQELKDALEQRDEELKHTVTRLVTTHEFTPIQKLVYGLVFTVMTAVLGAALSYLVVNRP